MIRLCRVGCKILTQIRIDIIYLLNKLLINVPDTLSISRGSYVDAVLNWPSARMYLGDVGTAVVTASQQRLPAIVGASISTL